MGGLVKRSRKAINADRKKKGLNTIDKKTYDTASKEADKQGRKFRSRPEADKLGEDGKRKLFNRRKAMNTALGDNTPL